MKILIATVSLSAYAGTDLYTASLSKHLFELGHEVSIYSPLLGEISNKIKSSMPIEITDNLEEIQKKKFDVLHIQHNVNAWMLRASFPDTPAIMVVHGILPDFEQPPRMDLGIFKYLVVSEGVREHLVKNYDIPTSKIVVLNNWVDTKRFYKKVEINEKPKKLLVLSNHMAKGHEKIYSEECKKRNIEMTHVGLPENPVTDVEKYINMVDVVVTVGRGAVKSMACGRNVIVSDINGIDGMVTPDTFGELIKNNFSGHRYHRKVTKKAFAQELDKYSSEYSEWLIGQVNKRFSPELIIGQIIEIYKEASSTKVVTDGEYKDAVFEITMLAKLLKDKDIHIRNIESQLQDLETMYSDYETLKRQYECLKIDYLSFINSKAGRFARKIQSLKRKLREKF